MTNAEQKPSVATRLQMWIDSTHWAQRYLPHAGLAPEVIADVKEAIADLESLARQRDELLDGGKAFDDAFNEMQDHTDGWNWYWLSYGEKCYAFATVMAFPVKENAKAPPSGGRLEPHEKKSQVWVAEDGTEMYVDEWVANVERQSGDVICEFIALAFAEAQRRAAISAAQNRSET